MKQRIFWEANTALWSYLLSLSVALFPVPLDRCKQGEPGPLAWATGMATGETKARLTSSSLFCHQAFVEAVAAPRVPNPPVHPAADPARFISNNLMRFIGSFSSPPTVRLRPEAEPNFVGRLEISGHRLDQKQKLCQLAPQSLAWRTSMVCTP